MCILKQFYLAKMNLHKNYVNCLYKIQLTWSLGEWCRYLWVPTGTCHFIKIHTCICGIPVPTDSDHPQVPKPAGILADIPAGTCRFHYLQPSSGAKAQAASQKALCELLEFMEKFQLGQVASQKALQLQYPWSLHQLQVRTRTCQYGNPTSTSAFPNLLFIY